MTNSDQTTYPLSKRFSIGFSAYEDRLLLTTEPPETGPTTVLLTRRMVLLMLKQILNKLPALTGLEQTPVAYWQQVLELTHQQAVAQHKKQSASQSHTQDKPSSGEPASSNQADTADSGESQPGEPMGSESLIKRSYG